MRTVLMGVAVVACAVLLTSCGGMEGDEGGGGQLVTAQSAITAPPDNVTGNLPRPGVLVPVKKLPDPFPCITCPDSPMGRTTNAVNPGMVVTKGRAMR